MLLSLLAPVTTYSQDQEQTAFTLEEAIAYAIEHNQDLLNAVIERQIAEKNVKEVIADGLPQINGDIDLAYNPKIRTTFIPDFISPAVYGVLINQGLIPSDTEIPDSPPVPAAFGTDYSGSAAVSLTQMLFDGSFFVGLEAAKTYTELSRKDQISTEIDVIENVSKAYYNALVNIERAELIERNFQRLDTLLRETQILYENGFAEKIDVSRIKVQYNNIVVQRKNSAATVEISKALLKFQMGMSPKAEISLEDRIDDLVFQPIPNNIFDAFDYENRIEYSLLQTNQELNFLDTKNVRMRYVPTIDLYGSLGAVAGTNNSSEFFDFKNTWFDFSTVGVRMNIPIFDGFRKSYQIQQRKLQGLQLQNSEEQLKNSIDYEIRQAAATYERALDNMEAQQENMVLAQEVYDVSKIKYEEGVGSSIEVTTADADYKEAQTNYYNALFDALIAKVELQKAYGVLNK
jgi:outer membrane protein TolC